jgi:hypothetical protein
VRTAILASSSDRSSSASWRGERGDLVLLGRVGWSLGGGGGLRGVGLCGGRWRLEIVGGERELGSVGGGRRRRRGWRRWLELAALLRELHAQLDELARDRGVVGEIEADEGDEVDVTLSVFCVREVAGGEAAQVEELALMRGDLRAQPGALLAELVEVGWVGWVERLSVGWG